jgi:hypothetical protein
MSEQIEHDFYRRSRVSLHIERAAMRLEQI